MDEEAEIGPTDDEWMAAAAGLAVAQSGLGDREFVTVRAALAETYALMVGAGAKPDDLYGRISEQDLQAEALGAFQELSKGDWGWPIAAGDLPAVVLSVAARVRALDRLLKHVIPYHGPPADAQSEYLCRKTNWFVIPL